MIQLKGVLLIWYLKLIKCYIVKEIYQVLVDKMFYAIILSLYFLSVCSNIEVKY